MRLQPAVCGGEPARKKRLIADKAFRLCPPHRDSPAYLEPNSQSLQKPVEGVCPTALLLGLYIVPLYKGAIVFSEHNRTRPTASPSQNAIKIPLTAKKHQLNIKENQVISCPAYAFILNPLLPIPAPTFGFQKLRTACTLDVP
jgi:hypothetical protein